MADEERRTPTPHPDSDEQVELLLERLEEDLSEKSKEEVCEIAQELGHETKSLLDQKKRAAQYSAWKSLVVVLGEVTITFYQVYKLYDSGLVLDAITDTIVKEVNISGVLRNVTEVVGKKGIHLSFGQLFVNTIYFSFAFSVQALTSSISNVLGAYTSTNQGLRQRQLYLKMYLFGASTLSCLFAFSPGLAIEEGLTKPEEALWYSIVLPTGIMWLVYLLLAILPIPDNEADQDRDLERMAAYLRCFEEAALALFQCFDFAKDVSLLSSSGVFCDPALPIVLTLIDTALSLSMLFEIYRDTEVTQTLRELTEETGRPMRAFVFYVIVLMVVSFLLLWAPSVAAPGFGFLLSIHSRVNRRDPDATDSEAVQP